MNKIKLAGYFGLFLILAAGLLPLAKINSIPITILPVFDNFKIGGEIWLWRNISAFAMTYYLVCFAGIFLIAKNNRIGIISISIILAINSIFILIVIWMTQLEAEVFSDIDFVYGYAWLVILFGIGIILWAGMKTNKIE